MFGCIGSITRYRFATEFPNRIGIFGFGRSNGFNNDVPLFFSDGDLTRAVKHPLRHSDAPLGNFYFHGLRHKGSEQEYIS